MGHAIHFFNAPSLGWGRKIGFGPAPNPTKKFRLPVIFQVLFGIPMAVGKKHLGVVLILKQFEMGTAFKAGNGLLMGVEYRPEPFNMFRGKGHAYDAYEY